MSQLKIIAFGDILANFDRLYRIKEYVSGKECIILFSGDIPNPDVFRRMRQDRVLKGNFKNKDLKKYLIDEVEPQYAVRQVTNECRQANKVFKEIGKSCEFYGVFGNADLMKIRAKVPLEQSIRIVHNKKIHLFDDYYLVGYSGRPLYIFENENKDENAFSEEEIYNDLRSILTTLRKKKVILLTHAPPYEILDRLVDYQIEYGIKTYGEKAKNGCLGSTGLRKIVDEFKPLIHIFGHIHEGKGVYYNRDTCLINVGSFGKSSEFAEITYDHSKVSIEFRDDISEG